MFESYFEAVKIKCIKLWRFILFIGRRFVQNANYYRAAALTITSLLAIVPLMSVMLSILSAFPVFEKGAGSLQDFIFENFVPQASKIVQVHLQTFAEQASRLSISGIVFLLTTAVLMK